jgi:hypothetical protein
MVDEFVIPARRTVALLGPLHSGQCIGESSQQRLEVREWVMTG